MTERYRTLDSIRGIAAMVVMLGHCYSVVPRTVASNIPIALINNQAAVIVFFVLSGFVLALPFFGAQPPAYLPFLTRRLCRIYIPFAVAILLSCILFSLTDHSIMGRTNFAQATWGGAKLTPSIIAGHLLMTGMWPHVFLDLPIWSLVHEMRVSIIFPLLVAIFLCRRCIIPALVFFSVLAVVAGKYYGPLNSFPTGSPWPSFLVTAYFLPTFMLGILLARYREFLCAQLVKLGSNWRLVLWIACLGGFSVFNKYEQNLAISLFAGLLIMLTLSSKEAAGLLMTPVLQWLGRISYSLYLTHLPVMFALTYVLHMYLSYKWIIPLSVAVALIVAEVMCRFVEIPAMRLGKRLSERLGKKEWLAKS